MNTNNIMQAPILITKPFDRSFRFECQDETKYLTYLQSNPNMCEVIGEYKQYIKPVFDVDAYDNDIDVNSVKSDINTLFPDKSIYYAKREARQTKKGVKYSYRFYVDGVKIFSSTLKELIKSHNLDKNPIYDLSIYDKNKLLFLPLTTKKMDGDAPVLQPVDCHFSKCCASYVETGFEDWNTKVDIVDKEKGKSLLQQINTFCEKQEEKEQEDEDEKTARKSEGFSKIITKHVLALSNERAANYHDWLEIIMCIINIGEKYEWKDDKIIDICDVFSQKDTVSYDEKQNRRKIYSLLGSDREHKVGYQRLLQRLKEDNPTYYQKNIIPSYREAKEEFEKEYCIINNPVSVYRTPLIPRIITENSDLGEVNQQLRPCDVGFQVANRHYMKKDFNKDGKVVFQPEPFFKDWLKDPQRLTYEGIVFRPSGMCAQMAQYYKNLFTGFKADKIELVEPVDYSKIQPILDHLKIVYCDGVEEHYQYVLKWFAKIIQDPEHKPQVGLVFYSKDHGTGRNTFTNYFQNEILGCDLTATCRQVERVFGKFNGILAKCMFLVIEEASGDIKKYMEDFKNLITEPTFTIEKKNIDAGTYKNYVNPILLTNNKDILDIDDKDRRFAIFESSACKKGDIQYFNTLYACLQNKKNAGLFIKYLREEVDASWTPMEFQQYRPITKTYRKQQSVNAKNYIKFISHITTETHVKLDFDDKKEWKKYKGVKTVRIDHADLYSCYKKMCEYYKYNAYPYDKFIDNITQDDTGITEILDKKYHKRRLLFEKEKIEKWVEIFRNTADEKLPVFEGFDDDEDDEDE